MLVLQVVKLLRILSYQVIHFSFSFYSYKFLNLFFSFCKGVGHVTIVDNLKVTKQDIQNNFFLDPESTGQSKAKSTAELLQELNEDASVTFEEKVIYYLQMLSKGLTNTIYSRTLLILFKIIQSFLIHLL